jgi:hypothetical protein
MTGEQASNDDNDFPGDDDFVLEDAAGKGDDLDQLFDSPVPGATAGKPPAAATPMPADAAEDDILFTDHTQGLRPTESFQGKPGFDESSRSTWRGEELVLDEAGVPPAETPEQADPTLAEAEADFTEQLGSLLQGEEEFALDTEKELELVDGPAGDGISELEQSGPFVLDDGEGTWQEEEAVPAADDAAPVMAEGTDEADAGTVEYAEPALVADEATVEPGWEPLPEANVDQLAEVGEVAPAEGEPAAAEADIDAAVEPATAGMDLAALDGHDVYVEDQPAPVLVGPAKARRNTMRFLVGMAAALLVAGGAAVTVLRPEWVGLALEPAMVEQVALERPAVQVAVPTPALVAVVEPPVVRTPDPTATTPDVTPLPKQPEPVAQVEPVPADPTPAVPLPTNPDPTAGQATTEPAQPVASATVTTPVELGPDPTPAPVDPVAAEWFIPALAGKPAVNPAGNPGLVRISDDTMLGATDDTTKAVNAVEGMLPGTRAFAQLHNGNYFIGAVKLATADRLTLRLDQGEITLASADIARLTQLGSSDYDALQRATSGFVRLTNNNRLVGGILSQIADDHIVLEFRSNRVMLPKSAVGQVVQGVDESGVRLDVTREEDEWLRTLAGRQIGSGTGAVAEPAQPKPAAGPGTTPPSPPTGRQR